MFASLIQIVTLFAFTAHAVLGCCWHHSHAIAVCADQAVCEAQAVSCTAPTTGDLCAQRLAERTHSHCVHSPQPTAGQAAVSRLTPQSDSQLVAQSRCDADVNQSCCGATHRPASHCTSIRCSYILAKLLTLDLADAVALDGFVTSVSVRRHLPAADSIGRIGHWPFFLCPHSSRERCASLQTWQI